jgi:hypothetical protein
LPESWYAAFTMARVSVQIPAKGGLSPSDQQRCVDFASKLLQSMVHAAHENSIRLSSIPVEHIGVERKPKTVQATMDTLQTLSVPSNPKWGVHQGESFISSEPKPRLGRARYGYSMEVETQAYFETHFANRYTRADGPNGIAGDYLYNDPNPYPALGFPVSFTNKTKGARPDWRLKLLNSPGGEAIFDATSELQEGHLLLKRVGSLTLANMQGVYYGSEIIYETQDAYFDTSSISAQTKYFAACVLVLGVAVVLMYFFDMFGTPTKS